MHRPLRSRGPLLLAAIGLLWAMTQVGAQAGTELKLLTSWGPNQVAPEFAVKAIIEEALKASGGNLVVKRYGPEVVPPFEQLQPVSSGTFDLLFTHPAYHGDATTVGALIDTIAPDQELRRSTGVFDWLDNYYQKKFNVKLLATPVQTGYQFLLKEPIKADGGLKGRKIRSNPAYDPIVTKLGAAPVLLPAPQIFTSLQKGLVDGSAYTLNSLAKQKLYEVAKYLARPTFGGGNHFFMVNLDKWRKLDEPTQKALIAAGHKAEETLPWFAQRMELEDAEQMIINGARYTYFSPEHAARLTSYFNEGLWMQAVQRDGAAGQEIVDLIKKTRMANK